MRPQSIGRVLGTGLRVAGRIAGQRMATAMASSPSPPPSPSPSASVAPAVAEQRSANASHRPARPAAGGLRRGASGLLRPFRRVGGIVWLEVTGSFFLLFALAFARALWSIGASWRQLFLAGAEAVRRGVLYPAVPAIASRTRRD